MFPSKYEGKCKSCGKVIGVGTQIEKNNDGNYCPDGKNCQGTMKVSGSAKPAVSIETVCTEIIAIRGSYLPQHTETGSVIGNTPPTLPTDTEIEGIWKYAISRMMSR